MDSVCVCVFAYLFVCVYNLIVCVSITLFGVCVGVWVCVCVCVRVCARVCAYLAAPSILAVFNLVLAGVVGVWVEVTVAPLWTGRQEGRSWFILVDLTEHEGQKRKTYTHTEKRDTYR